MNTTKRTLAFYGAKHLPFGQDVPDEAHERRILRLEVIGTGAASK